MKPLGYIVVEACEDYEQVLGLKKFAGSPPGGILDWTSGTRCMFESRQLAKEAIDRTEHYRLAFGLTGAAGLPEKKLCRIHAVGQP